MGRPAVQPCPVNLRSFFLFNTTILFQSTALIFIFYFLFFIFYFLFFFNSKKVRVVVRF